MAARERRARGPDLFRGKLDVRYVLPRRASSRSASLAASAACRRGGFAVLTFARGFFFSGALGFAAGVLRFAGFADGFAEGFADGFAAGL